MLKLVKFWVYKDQTFQQNIPDNHQNKKVSSNICLVKFKFRSEMVLYVKTGKILGIQRPDNHQNKKVSSTICLIKLKFKSEMVLFVKTGKYW